MSSIWSSQRIPIGRSIISDIPTVACVVLESVLEKEMRIVRFLTTGGKCIEITNSFKEAIAYDDIYIIRLAGSQI